MERGILLGRYYPGNSVIHKLDPRTKLIGTLGLIVMGFCALNPLSLVVCLCVTVALYALARIPVRVALGAIGPLMFIVAITVLLNLFFVKGGVELWRLGPVAVCEQGVRNAVFFGVRLLMFIGIACLLTLTTTTLDVTDGSERLLSPLARWGVPVHELSMMAGIALRFLPQFAAEFEQVRHAQMARGSHLPSARKQGAARLAALIVPLFSGVFRRADTLASAMDARCYQGGAGRTHLHPLAFGARDAIALLAFAAAFAVVIVCNVVA